MCVRVRASVLCVCMCEGDRYRVGYLCLTLRVSSYTAEWAQPISTSLGGGEPWLRYRRSNLNYFKFRVGIILIALVLLYGCFVDDWVYLMEHKHIMISFLDGPEVSLRDIFFLMWACDKIGLGTFHKPDPLKRERFLQFCVYNWKIKIQGIFVYSGLLHYRANLQSFFIRPIYVKHKSPFILNGAHDPLCSVISYWFTLVSDIRLTNGWSLSKNKNRRRVMFLHISAYYITDTIRSISSSSTRESTFQMLRKHQFVKNLL